MVIIGKYRPPGVGVHGAHCSAHGVGVHSAFRELVLLLVVIIDAEEAGELGMRISGDSPVSQWTYTRLPASIAAWMKAVAVSK